MTQQFVISERMAQGLAADHRRLEQLEYNLRNFGRGQPHYDIPEPPLLVKNNNALAVPAYGLMQPTGTVTLSGAEPIYTIDQPSSTFSRLIFVNGPDQIPSGATMPAQRGPIVQFAYDSGTPALGDGWGPKSGQWTATKNYPSCLSPFGVTDSTNKIAAGRLEPINQIIGKLAGDIAAGGSATVNLWGGTAGSETVVSSLTLTGNDWIGSAQTSGTKVEASYRNGIWYIDGGNSSGNVIGKTSGAIAKGSSGTVKIYTGAAGSETDSGNTVTAYNHFGDVADAKWVTVFYANGVAYLIAAEC